MQSKKLL